MIAFIIVLFSGFQKFNFATQITQIIAAVEIISVNQRNFSANGVFFSANEFVMLKN